MNNEKKLELCVQALTKIEKELVSIINGSLALGDIIDDDDDIPVGLSDSDLIVDEKSLEDIVDKIWHVKAELTD